MKFINLLHVSALGCLPQNKGIQAQNVNIVMHRSCFYSCRHLLLESGLSVRSQPVYCADVYRERRYQTLC
jgi:hypothetical protein